MKGKYSNGDNFNNKFLFQLKPKTNVKMYMSGQKSEQTDVGVRTKTNNQQREKAGTLGVRLFLSKSHFQPKNVRMAAKPKEKLRPASFRPKS